MFSYIIAKPLFLARVLISSPQTFSHTFLTGSFSYNLLDCLCVFIGLILNPKSVMSIKVNNANVQLVDVLK